MKMSGLHAWATALRQIRENFTDTIIPEEALSLGQMLFYKPLAGKEVYDLRLVHFFQLFNETKDEMGTFLLFNGEHFHSGQGACVL